MTQAYLGSMVLGHVLLQLCPGLQLAAVGAVDSVLEGAWVAGRRRDGERILREDVIKGGVGPQLTPGA